VFTQYLTERHETQETELIRVQIRVQAGVVGLCEAPVKEPSVPWVVDPEFGFAPPNPHRTWPTPDSWRRQIGSCAIGCPREATIRAHHDHHIWWRNADIAHMLWCPANASSILLRARMRTGARVWIRVQTNAKDACSGLI